MSSSTTSQPKVEPPPPRIPVVVDLNSDGYVQCYGPKNLDFFITVMPDVHSVQGEILAERYIESRLPKRFKEVFWPSNLRAADMVRSITASDLVNRHADLELLHTLEEIGRDVKAAINPQGGRRLWTA